MGSGKTKHYFALLSVGPSERLVGRSMSASLMSSTKWRTLFEAVSETVANPQIIAKFIHDDQEHRMQLPWLHAPHDFVDSLEWGPFPLLDFEWIEFPFDAIHPRRNNVPAEVVPQDIAAIGAAIRATGKVFPLEENARGLRVIGHVRSTI